MQLKTAAIAMPALLVTAGHVFANDAQTGVAPLGLVDQGSIAVNGAVKVEPGAVPPRKPLDR